jgi:hypothetical protein
MSRRVKVCVEMHKICFEKKCYGMRFCRGCDFAGHWDRPTHEQKELHKIVDNSSVDRSLLLLLCMSMRKLAEKSESEEKAPVARPFAPAAKSRAQCPWGRSNEPVGCDPLTVMRRRFSSNPRIDLKGRQEISIRIASKGT